MPAKPLRLLDPIDQITLAVALAEIDLKVMLGGAGDRAHLDVGQRHRSIHVGFAGAESVEVGPVRTRILAAIGLIMYFEGPA